MTNIILNDEPISPQFIQEYNATIQQELFALPIAPKKVATLQGMDLYSSDSLKDKYINAMYNISKVKPVAKDIERLIHQNKIVPCWINRGIFRLAIFKKLAPYSSQGIAGFFTPKTKQVFILMDNNIKWGFAKDKWLSSLMLHEMMHMASDKFRNQFIKTFWTELLSYYASMYADIFKTKGYNIVEETKLLIRFLFKNFEFGNHSSSTVKKYVDLVNSNFRKKSTMTETEFSIVLADFYNYIKLYFADLNQLFSQLRNYTHIYSGLKKGYTQGLGISNNESFCSQELFYPSEVIAMQIELYKGSLSKHFSVIKKL